jgi:hypothetical protein
MPPKAEVRHNLLVALFLDKLEEEYENTESGPDTWWSDDEARYLLRNYRQYNFTLEERDRASEEAIDKFYAAHRQNSMQTVVGIIGDLVDNVVSVIYGNNPGKSPADAEFGLRKVGIHYPPVD